MTYSEIKNMAELESAKVAAKFNAAASIRAILDEARKVYGESYDDDDVETAILELVTGDAE